MGETQDQLSFNASLRVDFQGVASHTAAAQNGQQAALPPQRASAICV